MTRNYRSRPIIRVRVTRSKWRLPSITLLGFGCFRLVGIVDREAHEPAFAPVPIDQSFGAMRAFVRPAADRTW